MGTVGAEVQEREAIQVGSAPPGSSISDTPFILPRGKVLTTPAVRRIAMENKVSKKFKTLY